MEASTLGDVSGVYEKPPHVAAEVDEAFESLKGYEEELMGLLDLFSKTEQDCLSATHFDHMDIVSTQGVDQLAEIQDLHVPDLMREGTSTWTEFLMDDFPGDRILPFPAFDSAQHPADFLAISMGPQDSCHSMQPSLPQCLFPPHDSACTDTGAAEGSFCTSQVVQQPNHSVRSLISQESSSSIAEIAQQELAHFQAEAQTQHVPEQIASGQHMIPVQYGEPANVPADSGHISGTEASAQAPAESGQNSSKGSKPAPKRKRASKPKDPNAVKRKVGRPRVGKEINVLKHLRAFEKDGGFTLGERAKILFPDDPAEESQQHVAEAPQPVHSTELNTANV